MYGEDCHSLHELGWVVIQKLRDLLPHMSSARRASSSAVQSRPLPCTSIKRWLTVCWPKHGPRCVVRLVSTFLSWRAAFLAGKGGGTLLQGRGTSSPSALLPHA